VCRCGNTTLVFRFSITTAGLIAAMAATDMEELLSTRRSGRVSAALLAGIMILIAGSSSAGTVENPGAPEMMLEGGSRGKVPFPHLRHQSALKDCSVCHAAFPQEKGGIDTLKAQGVLARKEIMNKQCIKCHKAQKGSAQPGGPITCSECHRGG
jgi:cytochrome c-type protein NrfB